LCWYGFTSHRIHGERANLLQYLVIQQTIVRNYAGTDKHFYLSIRTIIAALANKKPMEIQPTGDSVLVKHW